MYSVHKNSPFSSHRSPCVLLSLVQNLTPQSHPISPMSEKENNNKVEYTCRCHCGRMKGKFRADKDKMIVM